MILIFWVLLILMFQSSNPADLTLFQKIQTQYVL